jgi:hypothetical protein
MPFWVCSKACKETRFPIRRLYVYIAYTKVIIDPTSSVKLRKRLYKRRLATKFLEQYINSGRLKCCQCGYITADPIDKVRRILGEDKPKLKCPCCSSPYRRRNSR